MDLSALDDKINSIRSELKELSEDGSETQIQRLKKLENLRDEIVSILESPNMQLESDSTNDLTRKLQNIINDLDITQGKLLSETKNQLHKPSSGKGSDYFTAKVKEPTTPSHYNVEASNLSTPSTLSTKKSLFSKAKDIASKARDKASKRYSNQMVMDLQQKLLNDDLFVEESKLLKERTKNLKLLEQELVGIQDLYIQVSDHVVSQGEQLDSIENNITTSADYSRHMNKELSITVDRNRWSKLWISFFLIVVLICITIIYFSIFRR